MEIKHPYSFDHNICIQQKHLPYNSHDHDELHNQELMDCLRI